AQMINHVAAPPDLLAHRARKTSAQMMLQTADCAFVFVTILLAFRMCVPNSLQGGPTLRIGVRLTRSNLILVIALCPERHTHVNTGAREWSRINYKRPTDQANAFLHAREAQASASSWC